MDLDGTKSRQRDVLAVGFDPNGAGRERELLDRAGFRLEPGETHSRPPSVTLPGCLPARQRVSQAAASGGVHLFGILWPPRHAITAHSDRMFAAVPLVAQRLKRPAHRGRQVRLTDPIGALGGTLI